MADTYSADYSAGLMDSPDKDLLQEIRDNFTYAQDYWRPIHREGAKDMRVVAGDPWPKEDRDARESSGRLCLSLDEINQYLNQCINGVRHSKRAITVVPEGNGANDKTAEYRANIIRGVEYKCKAPGSYIRALQNAVERSYGYVKVTTDYESPDSMNLVLKIEGVPNPDVILLDPDAKKPDCSDGMFAFELDMMHERVFKQRWPNAEVRSFTPDHATYAPGWVVPGTGGYRIQAAKYWKVKTHKRKLVLMEDGTKVFMDEIPDAKLVPSKIKGDKTAMVQFRDGRMLVAVDWRSTEDQTVCQYITNGLEILEEEDWAGTTIPIVPCFGKELWVPNESGNESKRELISLVRMAREPLLMYCYARTAQTELCGMAPKNLWLGYEGQFDTQTAWDKINKSLKPYATVKGQTEESLAAGAGWLPLPQQNNFEPPIQALELLAESARRAIQSAIGINGLLAGKRGQDQSAKSGVALQELEEMQSEGTFHYVDNYQLMIEQIGRICDELLDTVYDMPRDVIGIGMDDKPAVLAVNKPGIDPKSGQPMEFTVGSGKHGVTITTGKSYQSERQEINELADMLASNEVVFSKIADLVVRLKSVNPIAVEIADRLAPPGTKPGEEQVPPQIQQKIAELQKELEITKAFAQEQFDKNEKQQAKLDNDKSIKDAELAFKYEELKANIKIEMKKLDIEAAKLGMQADTKELDIAADQANAEADRLTAEQEAESARRHEAEQAEASRSFEAEQAEAGRAAEAEARQEEMAMAQPAGDV